jgi:hypothetical protein
MFCVCVIACVAFVAFLACVAWVYNGGLRVLVRALVRGWHAFVACGGACGVACVMRVRVRLCVVCAYVLRVMRAFLMSEHMRWSMRDACVLVCLCTCR